MKLAWIVFTCGCGAGAGVRAPTTQPVGGGTAVAPATGAGVTAAPDVPGGQAAARDRELAPQVAGFVDAFTNTEPALTRDGKRVVFVSTRDGLPQLYLADARDPGAAATRLLTTGERIGGAFATEEGKALIFMSDTGADENWSFFRVGLDGKNLIELTPGAKLRRDPPIIPDGKPSTIFFSARKMSEARTTIYTTSSIAAGEPKPLYTDERTAFLADVSPDGKLALVEQYPARTENYLLALEVASGKTKRIYPASGQVSIFDAKFSVDGKRVYVATDGGEDQALVLALEPGTGKLLGKYAITPPSAQIDGISVAKEGGLIAVSLTVGNHSEIRLLDGKRLAPKAEVKLPLGQGNAHEFSQDGTRLTAQWSTPRTPTEIFSIDTATGHAEPLRKEDRPSLKLPDIETSSVDIPAFDGGKIPTNVYLPAGDRAKRRPVIVVYHGGPADTSGIRWSVRTAFLLSQGYAVVEPNVRGSAGYGRAFEAADNGPKRLDAFKDVETSARWVAAQPWADKDRLVVLGGSYGGYTTLIALSRWPELWRAGVDLFGVADLKSFMATTTGVIHDVFLVEFGDPAKDAEFLASISPSTEVAKIVDPTFVYAGANDPRVPRTESDAIVKALRARKVPSEYMVAANEGHSLAHRETQIAFFSRLARFLETALR
jgi:dipeptidyl aminopeptidase/acylaminoacyl peptidase